MSEKCERIDPEMPGEGYSCWVHNAEWPCQSGAPVLTGQEKGA